MTSPDPAVQTDEADAPQDPPAVEEIALDTALQWLQKVRPADILTVLKEPAAAFLTARAFVGFRVNAQGYANPVVRSRLAQDLVRDGEFRRRLKDLLDAEPEQEARQSNNTANEQTTDAADRLREVLERERQKRSKDRSQARSEMDALRDQATASTKALAMAIDERDTARRERDSLRAAHDKAVEQAERANRQIAKLRAERDTLLKRTAAVEKQDVPTRRRNSEPAADAVGSAQPSAFEMAAYRILERGDKEIALAIVNDVLRHEPANLAGLDIAATVAKLTGGTHHAVNLYRDLALAALEKAEILRAVDATARLVMIDPDTKLLPAVTKPLLPALKSAPADVLSGVVNRLARLGRTHPAGHDRLWSTIVDYGGPDLARRLEPPGAEPESDMLPLGLAEPMTAAAVIAAVDRGDVPLISRVRQSLEDMRLADHSAYLQMMDVIAATAQDESYLHPIKRRPRGDVLVDASNVAWYDEASGVADRPRLGQILKMRSTLRSHGYFPVTLICDAPLPFTVDDRDALRRMLDRREMSVVDTGVDADEILIREARRRHAPIVTNDYMTDWDPDGEIEKIRYAIPNFGPAYLLPD